MNEGVIQLQRVDQLKVVYRFPRLRDFMFKSFSLHSGQYTQSKKSKAETRLNVIKPQFGHKWSDLHAVGYIVKKLKQFSFFKFPYSINMFNKDIIYFKYTHSYTFIRCAYREYYNGILRVDNIL